MAWINVDPPSQSWSTAQPYIATSWSRPSAGPAETRLNRVFPQDVPSVTPGEIDFEWQIRSEGEWFVASDNHVDIRSSITDSP